jgi:pimeloyl-ACP methyl ester carboxylesterase
MNRLPLRRRARWLTLAVAGLLAAPTLGVASTGPAARAGAVAGAGDPAGLPANVPAAAHVPEPVLPTPGGWPFGEGAPRTSGTGRISKGASTWTDFLYDDHGALGDPVAFPIAGLSPTRGSYTYASPLAHNNGADIFRTAVGRDGGDTYWRVDWTTLASTDPTKFSPIAEWAIDTDANPVTGSTLWPAGAHLKSPGIDKALVVSGWGAWVVDPVTGAATPVVHLGGAVTIDTAAKSFVVRVPASVLGVGPTSTVRVASGVASPISGREFADVDKKHGALPTEPPVYNVGFRTIAQEPPGQNFWMENGQAQSLVQGDVSAYRSTVDWDALQQSRSTGYEQAEPQPTGYSNRWYVSSLNLGDGAVADDSSSAGAGDLRPNFLGPVQPYAVFVPTTYAARTAPAPLTWILHSLSMQQNQYGATAPKLLQQACEDRGSICATTMGRGPDGWYYDEAEVDFWQVWRELASSYSLDTERTVISGYSMGGWAAYHLGLNHPDLFAKAVALAGPPTCGIRVYGPVRGSGGGGDGRCARDFDTKPLIGNARHLPYFMADGVLDQLVPVSSVLEQIKQFDDLGLRYHFELYPAEDHLAYSVQDGFSTAVAAMRGVVRETVPADVDFTWYPYDQRSDLGIGPTGAYWVGGIAGRDSSPSKLSSIAAVSHGLRNPAVTPVRTPGVSVPGDPSPAVVQELTWTLGAAPATTNAVDLHLTNVGALTIDTAAAGLTTGAQVAVDSDGAAAITFHTPAGDIVRSVTAGHTTVTF